MTKKELGKKIFETSYLQGEFLLRSGSVSNEYFDKYLFESQPQLLEAISSHLLDFVPKDTDFLAGLETGGIPIATALSLKTGIPVIFVRKEAKTYGTCKFAEGGEIQGKKLCLIEDVVTTGGQVVESKKKLEKEGAKVLSVLFVINRKEGENALFKKENLKSHYLFDMKEIKG